MSDLTDTSVGDNNVEKISPEELHTLFGTAMPMVAYDVLFNSPADRPISEVRADLVKLSSKLKTAFRTMNGEPVQRKELIYVIRGILAGYIGGDDYWAKAFDYILRTDETAY